MLLEDEVMLLALWNWNLEPNRIQKNGGYEGHLKVSEILIFAQFFPRKLSWSFPRRRAFFPIMYELWYIWSSRRRRYFCDAPLIDWWYGPHEVLTNLLSFRCRRIGIYILAREGQNYGLSISGYHKSLYKSLRKNQISNWLSFMIVLYLFQFFLHYSSFL